MIHEPQACMSAMHIYGPDALTCTIREIKLCAVAFGGSSIFTRPRNREYTQKFVFPCGPINGTCTDKVPLSFELGPGWWALKADRWKKWRHTSQRMHTQRHATPKNAVRLSTTNVVFNIWDVHRTQRWLSRVTTSKQTTRHGMTCTRSRYFHAPSWTDWNRQWCSFPSSCTCCFGIYLIWVGTTQDVMLSNVY
jgi:hypothetical protein